MKSIKINQVKFLFESDKFQSTYEIFKVETDRKHFELGALILDSTLINKNIKSISFEKGSSFYVLMEKNDENKQILLKVCRSSKDGEYIHVNLVDIESVDKNIVLQLLLNALYTPELSFLRYNNLTGHLYYLHPKWIVHDSKGIVKQIKTLEIKVDKQLFLKVNVRTFTNVKYKKHINFTIKKFEQYPQFVLTTNNTICRKELDSDNNEQFFIMRQFSNQKNNIIFLDFSSFEKFMASKMGVLTSIIEDFNSKYNELANITLINKNIESKDIITCQSQAKCKQHNKDVVTNILKENKLRIIDCINSIESAGFCDKLKNKIFKVYKIKATIGKNLTKTGFNIKVIHNDDFYGDDMFDPHDINNGNRVVQHITLENFNYDVNSAIETVAHNIIIKQDIVKRKISLYNWTDLNFKDDIIFGIANKDEEDDYNHYYFMTIHSDGTFGIEEKNNNIFETDVYQDCINIFDENKNVYGIIRKNNGDTNIIYQTSMFTIPEIFEIKKQLENQNTDLRNKIAREEYFNAVTDIKLYEENGMQYYFVGEIGAGMNRTIGTASTIYSIQSYNNSPLMFNELLPLMYSLFVRTSRLTVIPFPFKYLREYIKLHEKEL